MSGTANGKAMMLGLSGPDYTNLRILAESFGIAATHGKLLDIASSPDALALAIVVAEASPDRIEVLLQDVLGQGEAYSLATLDGTFTAAQVSWIDSFTLALVLRPAPAASSDTSLSVADHSRLYVISATTTAGIRQLARLPCAPRHLSFSPNGQLAVTSSDDDGSPALINLDDESCRPLTIHGSFHVLAWGPDSSALLYTALGQDAVPGVFRYDLSSGQSVVVAIASGSAAYASDGTVIALGNSWLTWQRAVTTPDKPLNLQVALLRSNAQEIMIKAIGVATTPSMLARSRMIFSRVADTGVIDIVVHGGEGLQRELIEYSYAAQAAYPLATATIDAPLALSWSPDGKAFVVVDCGAEPNRLTVIAPPH